MTLSMAVCDLQPLGIKRGHGSNHVDMFLLVGFSLSAYEAAI